MPSPTAPIRQRPAVSAAQPPTSWRWPLALVLCAALLRVLLLADAAPLRYPDTESYVQAARDLVSGDYSLSQGRRTPGYPLVIALAGESQRSVVLVQELAGVLTSLLLYAIALAATRRPGLAFGVGLMHCLNLQQLYLEGIVLSESLSAFSMAATLAALVAAAARLATGRPAVPLLLLTGAMGAYALMVRPQFIYLIGLLPLLAGFAASGWRPTRAAVAAAAWVVAPMVVVVLAWSAVVQAKVGPFTVSTQSGFGLVNHVHDELEYAPDEFRVVREILIRTRDARIKAVGNGFNTVWYGWPEVQRATGWTLPQASQQFKRMSLAIIQRRPLQYVNTVSQAWLAYWTAPNLWAPDLISPPALRQALEGLWWLENKLLRLANLAFVVLVAAVLVWQPLRRRLRWDLVLTALATTVLLSSLLQALADNGSNSRYAMPTQPLVLVLLAVAAARWQKATPAPATWRNTAAAA